MRTSGIVGRRPMRNACSRCVIRVARSRGKPAICAPPPGPRGDQARAVPPAEPIRDEFLRNEQDSRRRPGHLPGHVALNIAAGAIFAPEKPAKPGYEIAVQEKPARGAAAGSRRRTSRCDALRQRRSSSRAKHRQAMPGLPHLREGRPEPRRPEPLGRRRPAAASEAGFNYSAAMKAKGGTWTLGRALHVPGQSAGFIPGTEMTFAGLPRGQQRADVIDFLNSLSDSRSRCRRRPRRRRHPCTRRRRRARPGSGQALANSLERGRRLPPPCTAVRKAARRTCSGSVRGRAGQRTGKPT